ncbi:AraC-like DNA-binding protein [Hydrogenophaga palleronii]|uniref:AraC-like DNA-binding protein n=1 Tax=Hydrogenophaga palleronii TaxID=65655 RepID=A0ABU1WRI1_9BURK|nr:helix-turn-helix domain-containing protein [Hydrogenophaga palleronii]MDR7151900.1 AraC-like DNA-binding protein [Hydrogenophaga palleronii]
MNVEVRSFNDVHQHARAIPGWPQEYDQLSRGSLNSSLRQVSTQTFQMFQEVMNRQVVQRGHCPPQRMCLAVSETEVETSAVKKLKQPLSRVVLLRNSEAFMLHAPEGLSLVAANVDFDRFMQMAELHLSPRQAALAKDAAGLSVSAESAARLKNTLYLILRQSSLQSERNAPTASLDKVMDELLLNAFLDVFAAMGDQQDTQTRFGSSVSQYMVRRSRELVEGEVCSPLSILDLCAKLRVSRRTLQASFQRVAGIGPLEYLRNLRLNAVRRRLGTTTAQELHVGDAAAEMGFFHLSHFARHYKQLFDELPSDTCRADGRPTLAHGRR